jgi:hypothetical protein
MRAMELGSGVAAVGTNVMVPWANPSLVSGIPDIEVFKIPGVIPIHGVPQTGPVLRK